MKSLYAYLYCNLGGVSSVLRERVRAAPSEDQFFGVFTTDAGGQAQLEALGVEVHLATDYVDRALRIAQEEEIDYFHLIDEINYASRIRETYAGTLVAEIHTSTASYLDRVNDICVAACDVVLVPSNWSREQVVARLHDTSLHDRVRIHPNIALGHDRDDQAPDEWPGPFERPVILWVGKLTGGKNWRDALRVMRDVRNRHPCRPLMVTGGSLYKEDVSAFLNEQHAIGVEVEWHHNLSRAAMGNLYRSAAVSGGVLLVTSLAESFGLVIIESFAQGLPVVCPEVTALPELVEDGQNGFIFPPGNIHRPTDIIASLFDGSTKLDRARIKDSVPRACSPAENHEILVDTLRQFSRRPFCEVRLTGEKTVAADAFNVKAMIDPDFV